MPRTITCLFVLTCLFASACIKGKEDPAVDGGGQGQDGTPKTDGPNKPLDTGKDTGKKDTGKDTGKKDGGAAVPGTWVQIKVKAFTMGAANGEACSDVTLERKHQVTLTRNFEMQTTEVTQDQFKKLMGFNKSYFSSCGGSCPVDSVSWHAAAAYCNELSKIKGVKPCYSCTKSGTSSFDCMVEFSHKTIYQCAGYRLPTEAEWEFAYRAGSQTAFYNGAIDSSRCQSCTSKDNNANKIGWYCANSGVSGMKLTPHTVGGRAPNAFGLFDMAGNLYEWTADGWKKDLGSAAATDPWDDSNASYKATKGGCWEHRSYKMRAAYRDDGPAKYGSMLIGFRCVRTHGN